MKYFSFQLPTYIYPEVQLEIPTLEEFRSKALLTTSTEIPETLHVRTWVQMKPMCPYLFCFFRLLQLSLGIMSLLTGVLLQNKTIRGLKFREGPQNQTGQLPDQL